MEKGHRRNGNSLTGMAGQEAQKVGETEGLWEQISGVAKGRMDAGRGEAGRRMKTRLYKYRHLRGYIIKVTAGTDLKGGNEKTWVLKRLKNS